MTKGERGDEARVPVRWREHGFAIVVLAGLAIPIGIADWTMLGPGDRAWIPLNLRGALIGAYVSWLLAHATLSTLWVALVPPPPFNTNLGVAHVTSGVAAVVLVLVVGFVWYGL